MNITSDLKSVCMLIFLQVLSLMGEMDEAVRRLEKAKSLDSEERAIQLELEMALQKRKVQQDKERQMYRRMMEGEKPAKQTSKGKSHDNGWVSYMVQWCTCTSVDTQHCTANEIFEVLRAFV